MLLLLTGSPESGRADVEGRIAETGERPPHDVPPSPRIRKIEPIRDPPIHQYERFGESGSPTPQPGATTGQWELLYESGARLRIGGLIAQSGNN